MAVELEFCDHCTKIIPAGEAAHIWADEIICGGCSQILRSVTEKQPTSQDSMAPVATHKSQWRSTHHKMPNRMEKHSTCPHCKHSMAKNSGRCSNCRWVPTQSSMVVAAL
jgi:hypothetical protein